MARSSLLFFVSLVWAACSAVFATAASTTARVGEDCPSVLCGNLTISSPFGLFPVQASQKTCMRSGFAFQVFCSSSNIPYLRYYDGDWFQILNIFYDNNSVLVTDVNEIQEFSSCRIPTNISKPSDPFSISSANQNLIFYNCSKTPAMTDSGLVKTRCGSNTFVRIGGHYGYDDSGSYFLEGCDAVAVPVLEGALKTDASRYEELISDGFLLTWQQGCCAPNMVQKRGTTDCQCVYPVRVELLLQNVSLRSNWSNNFLDEFASQLNLRSTQIEVVNFFVVGDSGLNTTMDIAPQTGVSFSAGEVSIINSSLSLHAVRIDPTLVEDYDLLNLTWFRPLAPAPGDGFQLAPAPGSNKTGRKAMIIVSVAIPGSLLITCIFIILLWHAKGQKLHLLQCKKNINTERKIEAQIVSYGSLGPKRYKYSEATKITSSLNNKLGEGGYGVVFKGTLDNGCLVAVKFLHDSKGEGEEFVNEVMSIGRTSHVNIVSLYGFCLDGSKRALIYEYMPNGSLDKYIYSEDPKAVLGWDKLYTIAIGIARGLEYLHHSCNTRIVHFDIKPQNILLDQDFCPKIADFGLAKLCRTKESKISMTGARGTIGFIAPEVHSRTFGVVSTKSDVYSYGMLLLEMVGGRKNVKSAVQNSSEEYFPHWIYDHIHQDDGLQAYDVTHEFEGIAKKMSLIGLWCIQLLPMHRPMITKVLEMFERGLDELDMPPKQSFSQILEDSTYRLNPEDASTCSGTKTQALSEVQTL